MKLPRNLTLLLLPALFSGVLAYSQVEINLDNSVPDPSATLDVKFNNKGFPALHVEPRGR